jgi:hypothetical protein
MPGRELLLAVPAGIALLLSPSIASGQYDLIERRCAELASSPADPRRAGDGVPIDRIRIQDAPSACLDAPRHQPQSSRTQNLYHYGRVLEANQNFEPARSYYLAAAEAGHPTAAFNPARLWESGSDGPKNAANWRESGYGGYSQGYTGLAAIFVKSTPANHVEAARWNQVAVEAGWARSPYPEIASSARSLQARVPAARASASSSKDTEAILGGIIALAGVIALVELLSGPSSSSSSGGRVSASPADDSQRAYQQQQELSRQLDAARSAREAGAARRQQERDDFYRTQRCGFNARANCL